MWNVRSVVLLRLAIVTGVFLIAGRVQAAPPFGGLDNPLNSDSISGIVSVVGWALDDNGIKGVDLLIDGVRFGDIAYGSSRGDVTAAHPGFPDSQRPGFGGVLNARLLSSGLHTITAKVFTKGNETLDLSAQVSVENTPGAENPRNISFDLTKGLLVADSTGGRVIGALSGGTLLDFRLTFNSGLNTFVPTSIQNHGGISANQIEATIGDWVFLHTLIISDAYSIQRVQLVNGEMVGVGVNRSGRLVISVDAKGFDLPFEFAIGEQTSTQLKLFGFNLTGNNPEVVFASQDNVTQRITISKAAGFRTVFRDGRVPLSLASTSAAQAESIEAPPSVFNQVEVDTLVRNVEELLPFIALQIVA